MPLDTLDSLRDSLWLWVALPALALAALALTLRGRAPQWRRFPAGLRALRASGDGVAPGLSGSLGMLGSFGAATAIGTATAVSLGGAGVLPWVWLFGVLVAPLRWGATLLAGTDAPGRGDARAAGSLPRRLLRMGAGFRPVGAALLLLTLATAFAWAGAAHAGAVDVVSEALLARPGTPFAAGAVVLGAALALAALASRGGATLLGWLAAAGLVTVLGAGAWAALADPAGAVAVLARAFGDAANGVEAAGPFTGALAGEIATAAALHVMMPQAATVGVEASAHALGSGIRGRAATAAALPLLQAVVATALVMAFVGSGAYRTRSEHTRPLVEGRFYTVPIATANDRAEGDRRYAGYVRLVGGTPRNPNLSFGFERGMVGDPTFELDGLPADLALEVQDGQPFRMMVNTTARTLENTAPARLAEVRVRGAMLPTGGALYAAGFEAAGGTTAAQLGLAALLALAVVGLAFWGLAAGRALPASAPRPAALVAGLLPAAGAGLALSGAVPGLLGVGGSLAAALA
ncbi:MAG: hypothetical protein AAF447_26680, partial [Myxococcota bacterium]